MMVLSSRTHLPKGLRRNACNKMEWTWGFYLDEISDYETRLVFRVRGNLEPCWLRTFYRLFIVPADFIMGRSFCLGLRKRVEIHLKSSRFDLSHQVQASAACGPN